MWRYRQSTGALYRVSDDGTEVLLGFGYSGNGDGLNNPAKESEPNVGPIPAGKWFVGAPYDSQRVGPFALRLRPHQETETFGRADFLIHGDNRKGDKSASQGCIVLSRSMRVAIHESDDDGLEVVA